MELFVDALLDALVDGVKMLPFLYLAYLPSTNNSMNTSL